MAEKMILKTKFKETEIGMIPEDWEIANINQYAYIVTDSVNPSKFKDTLFYHYSIPSFDSSKMPEIQKGAQIKSNKTKINPPSILVSKLNPRFKRIWEITGSEINSISSTEFIQLKLKQKDNLLDFFYYLLNYDLFTDYLVSYTKGTSSSHQRIDPKDILDFNFGMPKEEEALWIGEFLSILDSKIELNQQMNKTLESIGQSLFKHWFVDFESIRSSDWRVDELGKHIKFIKGKKPDKISEIYLAGYRPQILIENLNSKDPLYANEDGMTAIGINEPIMVMDGASSGRVEIGHDGILGSTLAKVITRSDRISNLFLYYFLKSKESEINQNTTGTSIPHADKDWIKKFQCVLPSRGILKSFNKIALIILNKIIANKKEIKTLSQVRDSLLPRLMSGRIRVNVEGI